MQVIAEHLFHEGLFDIGRLFVREAGVAGGEALQRPYASMHTVLQEVGCRRCWLVGCYCCCGLLALVRVARLPLLFATAARCIDAHLVQEVRAFDCTGLAHRDVSASNLAPALAWMREHKDAHFLPLADLKYLHSLLQIQLHNLAPALAWVREHEAALAGPGGEPSAFEFAIHRLAFLTLLKEQGVWVVLEFVGWGGLYYPRLGLPSTAWPSSPCSTSKVRCPLISPAGR